MCFIGGASSSVRVWAEGVLAMGGKDDAGSGETQGEAQEEHGKAVPLVMTMMLKGNTSRILKNG